MFIYFILGVAIASKKCTLDDDLEYSFSECNEDNRDLTVFFYYDKEKRCDMTISDPLPPFMHGVPCNHLCEDGQYS